MPPDLERRALRRGRVLLLVRYILLSAYVLTSLDRASLERITLGFTSLSTLSYVAVGAGVGLGLVLCRTWGRRFWPGLNWENPKNPMRTGPRPLWLVIIVVGGLSEELWRAFTIVELRKTGLTFSSAILVTALCFALGQLGGKPSRISGAPVEVYFTFFVGLVLGSTFAHSRKVVIAAVANVVYYLLNMFFIRKNQMERGEILPA